MNKEALWQDCLARAAAIVEAHKGPCEAMGFDTGASRSSGSTAFSRVGTTGVKKAYTLPSDLSSLLTNAYRNSEVPQGTASNESDLLNTLMTQSRNQVPGLSTLQETQGIDPTSFTGSPNLQSMMERNPYSMDYENAIGSMYDRMFAKGRAMAQSGPANVRGGTARQGFELAELDSTIGRNKFKDVREQQDREAGVVQQAIQMMNAIEAQRRGSKLQAQGQQMAGEHSRTGESLQAAGDVNAIRSTNKDNIALASELLGTPTQTTTDNVAGRGNQVTNASNWGAGVTCCFIFLEALNGKLPEVVRRGRDVGYTTARRAGYVLTSLILVPMMKRFGWAKHLVNFLLVRPFILEGEYWFENKRPLVGLVLLPYCCTWLWSWSLLGTFYGLIPRHYQSSTVRA